jgi:AcrR family transcriptional regulator
MRADARRNRMLILAAAEEAFAEDGLGVPVDAIAGRAGVGTGTLYRHFPTKEALFEAVVVEHMAALAEEARRLSRGDDPGRALFEFMARLGEQAASKRNLVEALLGAGIDIKERAADSKAEVESSFQVLLERAQAAGQIRSDVEVADVFALVMGTCAFAGDHRDQCSQARMLAIVCDGLRPDPTAAAH